MERLRGLFLLVGVYPLFRLWRGTAGKTLRHAVAWLLLAWGTWAAAWLAGGGPEARYLALALTACAGVAVLGARRPGVGAWNLVVAGLLAALCRPYLRGMGELKLEPADLVFLAAALAVGVGNYVPTRQGVTALVVGAWAAFEMATLAGWTEALPDLTVVMLVAAPWLALVSRSRDGDVWRSFRDAYGFLWAQRMREQFQRAAANAGLRAELGWNGLRGEDRERARDLLRAVLRRFDSTAAEQERPPDVTHQ